MELNSSFFHLKSPCKNRGQALTRTHIAPSFSRDLVHFYSLPRIADHEKSHSPSQLAPRFVGAGACLKCSFQTRISSFTAVFQCLAYEQTGRTWSEEVKSGSTPSRAEANAGERGVRSLRSTASPSSHLENANVARVLGPPCRSLCEALAEQRVPANLGAA